MTNQVSADKELDRILEQLHEKLLIGWIVNDGKPHIVNTSHGTDDGCLDETKEKIRQLFISKEAVEEANLRAALDELEAIMNCWEHPKLAPYFLTDRIAQIRDALGLRGESK